MSEGKVGCSEKVHDAFGVGFHPCSRVGRVERDGKWYCSQHDPCYVKKRREQRQVENQQQLKHQRIYSQVDMGVALRRAKGEVLELAARELCMYCNDPGNWAPMSNSGYHQCNTPGPNMTRCGATKIHALRRELDARAAQIEEGE